MATSEPLPTDRPFLDLLRLLIEIAKTQNAAGSQSPTASKEGHANGPGALRQ